ncbi:MAG: hypothetical protein JWQ81_8074 [Amycolatopsis sp.]|uniref:hypothetical protein n=1 Tax=Amycolatopsis sp. TaxID=37632 RepID=UPI00263498B6|nr:hypothetical protein [Amycolatopsis sp.]MCU1687335.1 hypothetical protein [Amycolatopsis sp.]
MPGIAEIHQLLAAARAGISDAHAATTRAKLLLEQARQVITDAQAQAQPWLPPQLAQAIEGLETQLARFSTADDLLNGYQARL